MDSTGAVKAHYEYSAFGEITAQAGPLTGDFTHRFSTKYFDKITGLYYYGHRYYDLVLMRWLSKDPIEEEGGLNLYCAMCNNAISFVDPFGLEIKGPDSIVVYSTNYDSRRNRLEYASDNKVCEWELTGNIKKYKSNSKSIYINPTSLSTAVDDSTLTAVYKDGSKDRKLITVIRPKYLTRWSADPLLAHAWQPRFHMVVTIYDQFDRHFPAGVYVTEKIGHTSSGFIRVYTLLGSAYTNLKGQIGDDFGAQLHRKKNAYLNIYQTIHIGEWKAVVVSQLLYKDALPDSDNFFGTPVIKFNGVKKANFHNY
ncbi:MAG: RHS repeat-associated core domain-containing protein [Bacteroidales bacterium]|nr:RHS repeat-associated core domain-containing protein [Bacteroidales bacterium]